MPAECLAGPLVEAQAWSEAHRLFTKAGGEGRVVPVPLPASTADGTLGGPRGKPLPVPLRLLLMVRVPSLG